MWLVRAALRWPHAVGVMAIAVALGGMLSYRRMTTDVFPTFDVPVVAVIWTYNGLPASEMERRIVNPFEALVTAFVARTDHTESLTLTGTSIIRIYLRPDARIEQALVETATVAQTAARSMPAGTPPPVIMRYSATSLPVMHLALTSDSLSEQALYDLATKSIRAELVKVAGARVPQPLGGKVRQVMVDIDPRRLHAFGLSARQVQAALLEQNAVLPSGTAKLGVHELPVLVNASSSTIEELAEVPIEVVDGRLVLLRDIANVRDGNTPQTTIAHVEGRRSVVLPIYKEPSASTLDVARGIREALPRALERVPPSARGAVGIEVLSDQSAFVQAAVDGVVHEAAIAVVLTALIILIFLGSWRSMLTVVISIPLSILFSLAALHTLGETLNTMTLGGLALSVGVLVDDATVEVENIDRNLAQGKPLAQAILDGAEQIAVPTLVSTICICIVFVPMAFLEGAPRSLFVPMALAVVTAMLMSYLLSRTLVPLLVRVMVERRFRRTSPRGFASWFEARFEGLRMSYEGYLAWALRHRAFTLGMFGAVVASSIAITPLIGRELFPPTDGDLIRLHVREPAGTRVEETEKRLVAIEGTIADVIPAGETASVLDVIGTPISATNLLMSEGALVSPADAQVLISLAPGHRPTADYVHELRRRLRQRHPEATFFFLPSDIASQVLSAGRAAPISVRVAAPRGSDEAAVLALARRLTMELARVPGAVDVHLRQVVDVPHLVVAFDRLRGAQVGATGRDLANDLLLSLSSAGSQLQPSHWLDKLGNQYLVSIQVPQIRIDSLDAIRGIPVATGGAVQPLGSLATITRSDGPANITHHGPLARSFDIDISVEDRDLGTVTDAVAGIVERTRARIAADPRSPVNGVQLTVNGLARTMEESFRGLATGFLVAIVLICLVLVINFRSWVDPLIVLSALPGALAGVVWVLFVTATPLSVPVLIGTVMCIGVSTANSVLIISFANSQRPALDAPAAAKSAGVTRLRPVLMTALAMMLGMVPMAFGLGGGGEQNAPLGRAVLGGLGAATLTTLLVVPIVYTVLRGRPRIEGEVA